jgi:hypothetical protein
MFGMEIPYSDLFTRTVALDLTNRHMKKNKFICLVFIAVLSVLLLASCGRISKVNGNIGGSTSSAITESSLNTQSSTSSKSKVITDSTVQTTAQDIQKILTGIQKDTAQITTDSSSSDTTDSTINDINSSLNGGQDNIIGLN